jgi:hypothetical protein
MTGADIAAIEKALKKVQERIDEYRLDLVELENAMGVDMFFAVKPELEAKLDELTVDDLLAVL